MFNAINHHHRQHFIIKFNTEQPFTGKMNLSLNWNMFTARLDYSLCMMLLQLNYYHFLSVFIHRTSIRLTNMFNARHGFNLNIFTPFVSLLQLFTRHTLRARSLLVSILSSPLLSFSLASYIQFPENDYSVLVTAGGSAKARDNYLCIPHEEM